MSTYTKSNEIVEATLYNGSNPRDVANFIEREHTHTALIPNSDNRLAFLNESWTDRVKWVQPMEWVVRDGDALTVLTDTQFTSRYTEVERKVQA